MATALIGYDGSEGGDRALRAARATLAADRVIVATVWEASLPLLADPAISEFGLSGVTVDPRTEEVLDEALESTAHRANARGVALARSLGFAEVVPLVEEDVHDVAGTLVRLAGEQSVGTVVVGSHGHRGMFSRLLGTTSTALVRDAPCPVLVVPADADLA
jgi:nucleotide-binding universal stress UspA family protein